MTDTAKFSAAGNRILPNTFQHPNIFVDRLMYYLTPEENTVLTFAVRRILGFQDNISSRKDNISLSQFTDGLKGKDGTTLCNGCGLRPAGVRSALDALEKFKVLLPTTLTPDPRKGQEYWLQENEDAIDWRGLSARLAEKQTQAFLKTSKARSSVRQKGSVPQTPKGAVPQKARVLSDSNTKPIETHGKKNGANPAPLSEDGKKILSEMGLDWQLLAVDNGQIDMSEVKLKTNDELFIDRAKDVANLIDMQCRDGGPLALAFMLARGIIFSENKIKGQRKAALEMLSAQPNSVKPDHVTLAVEKLVAANMTCTDLFSVVRTAIDLANPAPASSNERIANETY